VFQQRGVILLGEPARRLTERVRIDGTSRQREPLLPNVVVDLGIGRQVP
jgi:hypothetical protein